MGYKVNHLNPPYRKLQYNVLYCIIVKGLRVRCNQEKWTIEYWCNNDRESPIEKWFDSLNDDQFKSLAKELKLLELCGNQLKLPHSRSLKKGLFELRERKYGFRVYYGFCGNKIILVLHAGNKKSQSKDINIARDRLTQLIEK